MDGIGINLMMICQLGNLLSYESRRRLYAVNWKGYKAIVAYLQVVSSKMPEETH